MEYPQKSKIPYKLGPKVNYLIWSSVIIHFYLRIYVLKNILLRIQNKQIKSKRKTNLAKCWFVVQPRTSVSMTASSDFEIKRTVDSASIKPKVVTYWNRKKLAYSSYKTCPKCLYFDVEKQTSDYCYSTLPIPPFICLSVNFVVWRDRK